MLVGTVFVNRIETVLCECGGRGAVVLEQFSFLVSEVDGIYFVIDDSFLDLVAPDLIERVGSASSKPLDDVVGGLFAVVEGLGALGDPVQGGQLLHVEPFGQFFIPAAADIYLTEFYRNILFGHGASCSCEWRLHFVTILAIITLCEHYHVVIVFVDLSAKVCIF